jgi:hypothetical protein
MKSFIKEIEDKFIELEQSDLIKKTNNESDDEIDEQNVTGAVAGYNTPAAFAAPGKWKQKSVKYESVNTPPSYKIGEYQKPESEEEEFNEKFPFAENETKWYNNPNVYPSKDLVNTPSKASKHDHTKRIGKLGEMLDSKYEKILESYRKFATADPEVSPAKKVNATIREIAKKLQEIETLVNYNSKLKTEAGITSNHYGNSTKKSLHKISERLIKIAERVRSLGE